MNYKKQHYIPQTYLYSWCDTNKPENYDDFIWIFESNGQNPKKKNPKNIFYESELYTIVSGDKRILKIEHGLAELESLFSKIRDTKIHQKKILSTEEEYIVKTFVAALHNRTPDVRDHISKSYGKLLKLGKQMEKTYRNIDNDQLKNFSTVGKLSSDDKATFTLDEVEQVYLKPFETMLIPRISAESEFYFSMHMSFLFTDDDIGFITSDSPVVWFDPDAFYRPKMYQSVGLGYEKVEVTLPISPKFAILISHVELPKYIRIEKFSLDEFNRKTRFNCVNHFVVNKCVKNDYWFKELKPK